jgi:hypothetical protein
VRTVSWLKSAAAVFAVGLVAACSSEQLHPGLLGVGSGDAVFEVAFVESQETDSGRATLKLSGTKFSSSGFTETSDLLVERVTRRPLADGIQEEHRHASRHSCEDGLSWETLQTDHQVIAFWWKRAFALCNAAPEDGSLETRVLSVSHDRKKASCEAVLRKPSGETSTLDLELEDGKGLVQGTLKTRACEYRLRRIEEGFK